MRNKVFYLLVFISLLFIFSNSIYANSAQAIWWTEESSGVILESDNSPIIIEHETLKFDINTFKKPKDVELFESNYTIFIYDKEIPHSEFAHRNKIKIENDILLHSYHLDFIHPITNKKIDITLPLNNDFIKFINKLNKISRNKKPQRVGDRIFYSNC